MAHDEDELWDRGHKRPWWCFNVLTLFGMLFVLVWIRYLLDLQQGTTILLTVVVVIVWLVLGAARQSVQESAPVLRALQSAFIVEMPEQRSADVPDPPPWHVPLHVRNLADVPAFTTKDGSEIRELLAFRNSCIRRQSLAEARLPPGAATTPHYHPRTEEIYYILSGTGSMRLERSVQQVAPGDAIAIPPGSRHQITNSGSDPLTFLCCCAPAYEHEDTVLVNDWPEEGVRDEG